jgi:exodeoxyribonuclease V alpha subunit
VFNGTVGTITALSVTEQQLTVRTDEDEDIGYDFDELDELQHAYAITVHRSQGSEYPAVVVPLTMSAYTLLQRNLLYTAVTRAKRLVVLVGSRKALAIAVRTAGTGRRHTALTHRLQNPATPPADPRAGQNQHGTVLAVSPAGTPLPVRGRSRRNGGRVTAWAADVAR